MATKSRLKKIEQVAKLKESMMVLWQELQYLTTEGHTM
jgi:hypothetical protein